MLLIASEKWPWTLTPGIEIATLPLTSPARPAVRSTRKPVPPESVTKFVVPSPKAALAFVRSTRTTLSAPTVAFSRTTSAEARWPPMSMLMPVPWTRRYGPAGRVSDSEPSCSLTARIDVLIATPNVPVRNGAVTVASSLSGEPVSVTTKMPCPFVTVTTPARSKCTLLAAMRIVFGGSVPGGACGLSVPVTCSNSKSPPSVMPPTVISSPSALTRMVCAGIAGDVDATGVVLISSVNVPGLIETPGRVKASAHVRPLAVAVAARSSVRVVDVGAAWITYVTLPILMFLPMSAAAKFPDAAVNVADPRRRLRRRFRSWRG